MYVACHVRVCAAHVVAAKQKLSIKLLKSCSPVSQSGGPKEQFHHGLPPSLAQASIIKGRRFRERPAESQ